MQEINKKSLNLSSEKILTHIDLLNFSYQRTSYHPQSIEIQVQKASFDHLQTKSSKIFPVLSFSSSGDQFTTSQSNQQEPDYLQQFQDFNQRTAFYRLFLITRIHLLLKAKQHTRQSIISFLQSLLNQNVLIQSQEYKSQRHFVQQIEKFCYGQGKCQVITSEVLQEEEKESIEGNNQLKIAQKSIKQVISESIGFPGLSKFQKSILCNVEAVEFTKLLKKVFLSQDLLNQLDTFIVLTWESKGGWIQLLKPAYQQGGSRSNVVQFIAMRLRSLTNGSKWLQKKNNNPDMNSIMVNYSRDIAPLHQTLKKLKKQIGQAMNWDPTVILNEEKAIEFLDLDTIAPKVSHMQTTVSAFYQGLQVANQKVQKFLSLIEKNQGQQDKGPAFQFKSVYNSLRNNLRQLIQLLIKEQPIFLKSTQDASEKQPTQSNKKTGKFKIPNFGYGTQKLISYIKSETLKPGTSQMFKNPLKKELSSLLTQIVSAQPQEHRRPKIPKGTRDMDPFQMKIKQIALNKIRKVFQSHGALQIDTPVFQLKQTLTGKYGQDSKLIYDLQDQGGELLSLRYDLTVPFARYVALKNISSIKRFHIAKVYRRDNPQIQKGRFRQFYQCDFDIAGAYSGVMLADADVLRVIVDILKALELGVDFLIKINHRKFLDAIISLSGCNTGKSSNFSAICSSIDKLDKQPWENVRNQLIYTKKIDAECVDRLGNYVNQFRGGVFQILSKLKEQNIFQKSQVGAKALSDMQRLAEYMRQFQIIDKFELDFSLARGLDYYTGMIFQAVLVKQEGSIGSIAGGGRYDELIGQFSGGGKKKTSIPSVGGSIGIERIFSILQERAKEDKQMRAKETQVLVCSIGKDMINQRLSICNRLWKAGFNAQYLYVDNPKPANQLTYALQNLIPLMIWIGQDEVKDQKFKLKMTATKQQIEVPLADLEKTILKVYEEVKNEPIIQEVKEN